MLHCVVLCFCTQFRCSVLIFSVSYCVVLRCPVSRWIVMCCVTLSSVPQQEFCHHTNIFWYKLYLLLLHRVPPFLTVLYFYHKFFHPLPCRSLWTRGCSLPPRQQPFTSSSPLTQWPSTSSSRPSRPGSRYWPSVSTVDECDTQRWPWPAMLHVGRGSRRGDSPVLTHSSVRHILEVSERREREKYSIRVSARGSLGVCVCF